MRNITPFFTLSLWSPVWFYPDRTSVFTLTTVQVHSRHTRLTATVVDGAGLNYVTRFQELAMNCPSTALDYA